VPRTQSNPSRALPVDDAADDALSAVFRRNLRRLRLERDLSFDELAETSGIAAERLRQLERGSQVATLDVVPSLARALGTSWPALLTAPPTAPVIMQRQSSRLLRATDYSFSSRLLFPPERMSVELLELILEPGSVVSNGAHPPGTHANLVVARGAIDVELAASRIALGDGDAILFASDEPHAYRNRGAVAACIYVVVDLTGTTSPTARPLY
jgi:transcriptional regulator with XRE-family HTH domain